MDDKDLIEAFLAGDQSAFAELVSRHRRHAYRVARSILRRHDQADEATQEAFVKAYQALDGFQGRSSFRTWIHRITRNAALDLLAREATQARVAEQAAAEPSHAPPEPARTPRPVGTAKANFHHAVKNLKKHLSAAAEELRESTG